MIATFRYEFHMQIRRPALWIVYGLAYAATVAGFLPLYLNPNLGQLGDAPKTAVVVSTSLIMSLLPMVYGCLITDRLVRDRWLGVGEILNATPAGRTGRLIGKYLGVCAATAVPLALVHTGRAVVYAITEGEPAALGWAGAILVLAVVPGLLMAGALALTGPLLMSSVPFQMLFVAYWFWGSVVPASVMPTLSDSVLSPGAEYVVFGLLGYEPVPEPAPHLIVPPGHGRYPPWPDAPPDFLRPEAGPAVAWLWIGVMLGFAALLLLLARLHAIRTES
ncbi:ABC transporter permease [Streptosporangium sp. NPDC023615]|uniref:ABC transporter permease n=1 Tax=Streptosporangium sp. NPDC023615 TaxID=3154794 RepID=UPI003434D071